MKILYVGQLNRGGTCLDRMNSLRKLGHEVFGFNVSEYQSENRILRSIQSRLKSKILLEKLNSDLVKFAGSINAIELIWIDKGVWIFPETINTIKLNTNALVLQYTPDSQLLINKSIHFTDSIQLYDVIVTTKSFEIDTYRHLTESKVMLVSQSYSADRYMNLYKIKKYECDIGFISDYKPHYGRIANALKNVDADVRIWGPKWNRAVWWQKVPKEFVHGNGLWGEDYVSALASFKIGLGLLSKYIPEQHTTRTFEIPAAGTFMLAERTQEHLSFFEEGVEAEYFSTHEELVDKARFYLANEIAREKIAQAGHKRCINSGYDNDSIIARIMNELMNG